MYEEKINEILPNVRELKNAGRYQDLVVQLESKLSQPLSLEQQLVINAELGKLHTIIFHDNNKAESYLRATLQLSREQGSEEFDAFCNHYLGTLASNNAQFDEAERLLNKALVIRRRLGLNLQLSATLNNLAILHQEQGNLRKAYELMSSQLTIPEFVSVPQKVSLAWLNMAELLAAMGRISEAYELYERTAAYSQKHSYVRSLLLAEGELARLELNQGKVQEAQRRFNSFEELRTTYQGSIEVELIAYSLKIQLLAEQGNLDDAQQLLGEFRSKVKSFDQQGFNRRVLARTLMLSEALVMQQLGDPSTTQKWEVTRGIAEQGNDLELLSLATIHLVANYVREGQGKKATKVMNDTLEVLVQEGSEELIAWHLTQVFRLQLKLASQSV